MTSSDLKQHLESLGGESKAKGNPTRRPATKGAGDTPVQQSFSTELHGATPHDPTQPKANQCDTKIPLATSVSSSEVLLIAALIAFLGLDLKSGVNFGSF